MHEHDTYQVPGGPSIRVLNGNLLVKKDPLITKKGLIEFPDGAVDEVHNTGTILAVGFHDDKEGGRVPLHHVHPDLIPGNQVVFVRYIADVHTNERVREMLGEDVIRLTPTDILLVFDEADRSRLF